MTKSKVFNNVLDPWFDYKDVIGVSESKEALLHNYKKASFLSLLPRVSIKRKSDIVVMGASIYKRLDSKLQEKTHVVILARDIFKDFSIISILVRSFTFDLAVYKHIYDQIINKRNSEDFLYIKHILMKINPKIIILKSTIDPINRVWAFWADQLDIKIICIQHGIFSSKASPEIMERDIVDHYIVLGEEQSKIISGIIPKHKHISLYKSDSFYCNLKNKKTISICFIGTDYERYSKKGKINKEKVLDIYESLMYAAYSDRAIRYKFYYKRHPSEAKSNRIINLSSVALIQESDYYKIDIFFGAASTLLVNLASLNRCALQLRSKAFLVDNYQELGYCGAIDIEEIKHRGLNSIMKENRVFPCVKEKEISEIIRSIV